MKLVKGIYLPDSDTHFEKLISVDGSYQKKQFDAALKYIKPEDRGLFIDIGAHVGLWSRMAIKAGFNQIACFEPDKNNFECLKKNLIEFEGALKEQKRGIRAENFALSDKKIRTIISIEDEANSGAKTLGFKQSDGDHLCTNITQALVFDDCYDSSNIPEDLKNRTLIKIDVQGYEAKVVRGMKKFIQEYKPIIIVEQWLNGQADYEATMILKSYGMKTLESVEKEVILGW